MLYTAVITAAGSGSRMNLGYNKVLYEIEPGIRVIDKSVELFKNDPRCKEIIVTLSKTDFDIRLDGVIKVLGGKTRSESVYNGVQKATAEYVLIHDGARPYLRMEEVDQIVETLKIEDACLLATREKDTLKVVEDGYVVSTIDRTKVWHAQTPQAFKTELIRTCLKKAIENNDPITDDVSAVTKYSQIQVKVIEGDERNIKLTTIADLEK